MDIYKQQLIDLFLTRLRNIALTSGIRLIVNRQDNKNKQGLRELGLTGPMAIDEIVTLSAKNYSGGPENDEDCLRTGDVWIFGKVINGKQVYIKLKIDCTAGKEIAKCLSFHPAEYPMNFPFK